MHCAPWHGKTRSPHHLFGGPSLAALQLQHTGGRIKVGFGSCFGTSGDFYFFTLPPMPKDSNLHATLLFLQVWSVKTGNTAAAKARTLWFFSDSGNFSFLCMVLHRSTTRAQEPRSRTPLCSA